ncbi:MAG TPA: hypothetical protein VNX68_00015 [Nitrosopumilaceae archaeon]|nr:hypothetical protein [Nitrosopumilaceae archaeon]
MADYDPDTFYNLYSYCIHNLRDTLIKVEDLKINDAAKKNYKEFKRSFLKGEASGNFNKKADEILAKKLKESLTDIKKPLIGYSQKVYISWVGPKGEKITERNLVFYTVKLEVVNFANCETATKGN